MIRVGVLLKYNVEIASTKESKTSMSCWLGASHNREQHSHFDPDFLLDFGHLFADYQVYFAVEEPCVWQGCVQMLWKDLLRRVLA